MWTCLCFSHGCASWRGIISNDVGVHKRRCCRAIAQHPDNDVLHDGSNEWQRFILWIDPRELADLEEPLIYALLAGVSLGLYLDTWPNGFLFEGILIGFVVFQSINDHLKGRDVAYLGVPCAITFAIAMLMVLPFVKLYSGFTYYEYSLFQPTILILGIFFVLLILFASNFLRGCNRCFFPAAVIGIIVLGFLVLLASLPQFMGTLVYGLSIFLPKTGGAATVAEVSPLLYPEGQFSLGMVYANFRARHNLSILPGSCCPGPTSIPLQERSESCKYLDGRVVSDNATACARPE